MMFQQIWVADEDRHLQKIIWRYNSSDATQAYTLNTVTYGTNCAPYLAMRCLRHLATQKEAITRKAAAKALLFDFYMDDVLTGGHNLQQVILLRKELSELLAAARFSLRKWRANNPRILQDLSQDKEQDSLLVLNAEESVKTLGLLWNSAEDTLHYTVNLVEGNKTTKRSILSQIARIYDPLGLIGPIIITAKMTMQELWKLNIDWDEAVPQAFYDQWSDYYNSLQMFIHIKIPRNFNSNNSHQLFALHGFGDASEKAYGACVYCVYKTKLGIKQSYLVCSKSRAPVKTISLPKLELCAALLLSRLVAAVISALRHPIKNVHLWSDSSITLCWIDTAPHKLKSYYANRVTEIQGLTTGAKWHQVPSAQNSADVLSRGTTVKELIMHKLWWFGPSWLPCKEQWPSTNKHLSVDQGLRERVTLTISKPALSDLLRKYSSFNKLKRIIAYCLRVRNILCIRYDTASLSVQELHRSEIIISRMVQAECFTQELRALQQGKRIHANSSLAALNAFVDEDGVIRVGGRLQHANIPVSQKHSILLPAKHHITELILRQEHQRLLHCGPQQLLAIIRKRYWPLSGRRAVRKVVRNCMQCFRYRPNVPELKMANLPASRVTGDCRPFVHCGIDYAGPFNIRESKRRGNILISKAYVAVFVCFKTKAIHLELVSNLSTEAFMAAFRRFCSRRGTCAHMYSDNGTNLIGAANELKEVYEFLIQNKQDIEVESAVQNITWHFIPPRAPHFGGLWEAAVKSIKRHLQIIIKGLLYTFEEYYTLLVEIEGILNSRPLTALSSDPNDFSPLTPAHFLIGESLRGPAEYNYLDTKNTHLSRWQHIQKLRQHFWQRWHKEYLQQLQTRTKWKEGEHSIQIGDMVLLIEDNLSLFQWRLGRVEEVHPGDDGLIRVVTVRTSLGKCKRAVKKICALPYKD